VSELPAEVKLRSQVASLMMESPVGLRYNEKAVPEARKPSAQGYARPVRALLGRETSPAALFPDICVELKF
jgi:hypothetical protein